MARARIRLNASELRNITRGPTGPVVRHITTLTRRATARAKRLAPVDEGTLRASIQGFVITTPRRVIGRIGTGLEYGLYQHEGTGIHGPRGRPITPIRRKFLRFEVKSGRSARGRRPLVFARSVAGTRPKKFLIKALEQVSPYPVRETPT